MDKFITNHRKLLKEERKAEIEENRILCDNVSPKVLEKNGLCILKLYISKCHIGLFDRTIVFFKSLKELPAHNLSTGDIVGLSLDPGNSPLIASGIVFKLHESGISVAFDDYEKIVNLDENISYKVIKLTNDVTYKRLQRTLDLLETKSNQMVNVLFGDLEPTSCQEIQHIQYFNNQLDASQKEAVLFALNQKEVGIIHGPPGTGKTTTLIEIIRQSVHKNLKVLVCAPSNIAVDNLVEKLSGAKIKMVRLGHPARVSPSIMKHSLDAIVCSCDGTKIVKDVKNDINKIMNLSHHQKKNLEIKRELKTLRNELKTREEQVICDIFSQSQVILSTLTMASDDGPLSSKRMKNDFDLVVIDECSQALEVACWTALLRGKKCILAGDPCQLPPTILSTGSVKEQLEVTLMERLMKQYDSLIVRMLNTQYRMHHKIMDWSSKQFYGGKLNASEAVAYHLLKDLSNIEPCELTSVPVMLIDTAGCGFDELVLEDCVSKGNEGEANVVCNHVEKLLKCGMKETEIGIIVPYNLQADILKKKLHVQHPFIDVKTVDGFQGREKEAIVISLVRSNTQGEVGFLSEKRRINVAITRARRHLAIVCDSETVSQNEIICDLINYISTLGEIVSAHEVLDEIEFSSTCRVQLEFVGQQKTSHVVNKNKKKCVGIAKSQKDFSNLKIGKDSTNLSDSTLESQDFYFSRKAELLEMLTDFQNDKIRFKHKFPETLTSRDRLIVHQLCEELGLLHVSKNEGTARFIEVSKLDYDESTHSLSGSTSDDKKSVSTDLCSYNLEDSEELPQLLVKNKFQGLAVARQEECYWSPFETEEILQEAESSIAANSVEFECAAQVIPSKKVNKGSNNQPHQKDSCESKKALSSVATDVDVIVKEAMQQNKQCSLQGCKTNVSLIGQCCLFCKKRYCLSHHIAECHGCGKACKAEARKKVAQEKEICSGLSSAPKVIKPEKRLYLKSKLQEKLDVMSQKRTGKSVKK